DLGNNYQAVHRGSDDAGLLFRGSTLDHHSIWFLDDKRVSWFMVFDEPSKWGVDVTGAPSPVRRPNIGAVFEPPAELPWNVPGLAILLALVLLPLARTPYVEPAAVIVSGLVTILATFAWRRLARGITDDRRTINLGLALAFLGTPAWHYGRSLFAEPYLIALILGTFTFALVKPRYVLSGFLMGMAIYIKPFIVVVGIPLGVMFLAQRRFGAAIRFALPVVAWIVALLGTYHVVYGSASRSPNDWSSGPILINSIHLLAYPTRGLLTTAPIALVALAGWPGLVRRERAFAGALGACLVLFVLVAANRAWAGGYAYSVRYLVPVVPLACLGLVRVIEDKLQTRTARVYFAGVALLSVAVNALAAVQYWRAFNGHPFIYLLRNTDFGQ
ncbi:MAG TPA: glycosyltransferase family 87 protein, partial [Labilithrix sp.]|nr:glycosyltransferase family 87 protein [Labilithrix sp.]